MICLRLFVALLTATAAVKESKGDELLIFASIGEDDLTTFHMTLIDLKHPTKLLTIPDVTQPVDNLFVNLSSISNFLFWNYKDSENIGYLDVLNNSDWKLTAVKDARNGVFLGPGDNDAIYVYLKEDRKVRHYNFETNTYLWEWNGLQDVKTDMQCMDRNPCRKEWLLFAACSGTKKTAYKINIKNSKVLKKIPLTDCYETWRIAPNVEDDKVFAAKGRKIYVSQRNQEFQEWLDVGSEIIDLAIGKNYIFVITDKQKKVFRINWKLNEPKEKDLQELNLGIKGKLTNIIVYATSKDIC